MHPPETHVTVNEIWHLALPTGATLAGGRAGLRGPVEWVASLRGAFPLFGDLSEGYLALAHLELARKLDPRLTPGYLLNALHRAQAAALVVDEPISSADAALADRLGLPIFILPEGADLHAIERDILRTLVDREGQLARREMEVRQYLQQVFGQGGMPAVLNELARLTAGEVTVLDERATLVARAEAHAAENHVTEAVFPIEVAGQRLGRLVLYSTADELNPIHVIYARQTAEMCGIEMLQRRTRQETEERLGLDLVEQILSEDQDDEIIAARLARMGYDLGAGRRHVVMALGSDGQTNPYVECHDVAHDLRWMAERDGAGILMVNYRGYLIVLCSMPSALTEPRVRQWLRDALANDQQGVHRCRAGVSRFVSDLEGLRAAVCQAVDAWELGRHITDHESPHFYEEMGLYRLLAGLRDREELRRFYDETLGALMRYDLAHNTELVRTLEAFFEQNANASQTSRALFVHRNTLNYRLQRIVDITGLDLNDAEARLAFQLALKIHHLTC